MKIVVLDAASLGVDVDLSPILNLGEATVYEHVTPEQAPEIIADAEVIVYNKTKLTANLLAHAKKLKLACVTATGFDTVDTRYCREHGIGVCNVPGYSTDSVAQLSVALALNLATHLGEYREFVHSGAYSAGNVANKLSPCWNELRGKTWGIIGGGNIGNRVAHIAKALGCRVVMYRRNPDPEFETVDLNTLCETSDIISIHLALNDQTRGMVGGAQIGRMKKNAIVVNVARGAITDEEALTRAIEENRIGALGVDVYSVEPFGKDHPFSRILDRDNVCLTPHMAWGSIESRNRCIAKVAENIAAFYRGESLNRVE